MEEKTIGGISLTKWRAAFAELCRVGMEKDYFSDTLFFDLYPNVHEEASQTEDEEVPGCAAVLITPRITPTITPTITSTITAAS